MGIPKASKLYAAMTCHRIPTKIYQMACNDSTTKKWFDFSWNQSEYHECYLCSNSPFDNCSGFHEPFLVSDHWRFKDCASMNCDWYFMGRPFSIWYSHSLDLRKAFNHTNSKSLKIRHICVLSSSCFAKWNALTHKALVILIRIWF